MTRTTAAAAVAVATSAAAAAQVTTSTPTTAAAVGAVRRSAPAGVEFETGVQEGDGFVSITMHPVAQTCPVPPIVIEPTFTG